MKVSEFYSDHTKTIVARAEGASEERFDVYCAKLFQKLLKIRASKVQLHLKFSASRPKSFSGTIFRLHLFPTLKNLFHENAGFT